MPFLGKSLEFLQVNIPNFKNLQESSADIPLSDITAWLQYPDHKWIYNKLELMERLKINSDAFGVLPDRYPVFMKPMMNLRGCGNGNNLIQNEKEYFEYGSPGKFWMTALEGDHLSHDIAVAQGNVVWSCCFKGHPIGGGMFDYWQITEKNDDLEQMIQEFVANNLQGTTPYTGCINLETIDGTIIEGHLRIGDACRIGDIELMNSIVELYNNGTWSYTKEVEPFTLFAIFGPQGIENSIPEDVWSMVQQESDCSFLTPKQDLDKFPDAGTRIASLGTSDFQKGISLRNTIIKSISPELPERYTSLLSM